MKRTAPIDQSNGNIMFKVSHITMMWSRSEIEANAAIVEIQKILSAVKMRKVRSVEGTNA